MLGKRSFKKFIVLSPDVFDHLKVNSLGGLDLSSIEEMVSILKNSKLTKNQRLRLYQNLLYQNLLTLRRSQKPVNSKISYEHGTQTNNDSTPQNDNHFSMQTSAVDLFEQPQNPFEPADEASIYQSFADGEKTQRERHSTPFKMPSYMPATNFLMRRNPPFSNVQSFAPSTSTAATPKKTKKRRNAVDTPEKAPLLKQFKVDKSDEESDEEYIDADVERENMLEEIRESLGSDVNFQNLSSRNFNDPTKDYATIEDSTTGAVTSIHKTPKVNKLIKESRLANPLRVPFKLPQTSPKKLRSGKGHGVQWASYEK